MLNLIKIVKLTYERDDVNIAIGMKKGNETLLKDINSALSEISKETRRINEKSN